MKRIPRHFGCLAAALAWPALATAGVLADAPLTTTSGVPPNVMFALSVEYPTANTAAYQGTNDYSAATTYLGYFDAAKCYTYDRTNGWFAPSALATNHECASAWSGNFLNWATMTGLDEFRFAMTGGNRYQDTPTLTVLERAYQSGQGGVWNFPDKTIASNKATPTSSTLTLVNQGMGTRVSVTANPSIGETIECTGATWGRRTGFNCSLQVASATSGAQTATCSTWSGDGGSNPFQCTRFGEFSAGESCSTISPNSGTSTVSGKSYYTSYSASNCAVGYQVRVKVCDPAVGLEGNCTAFGRGWKPTGVVQTNGTAMRFGVTSYFQANDVDNAVLRSKMKFVAPRMYASSGTTIANPYMEWSAADGTFYRNPANCDSGATGCTPDSATVNSFIGTVSDSGVINYINKFGSNSHTYKTFDDAGKLHYEALKYLRGLPPTRDFYNGAKFSNADGFPVITTWDDPQQYSCQKNYIITLGDTHTWCDKRLPGGTYESTGHGACNGYTDGNGNSHPADTGSLAEPGAADPGVDVTAETNRVGGWEGMSNVAPPNMTGAGGAGYGIAGLAAWAARTDVRHGDGAQNAGSQFVKTFILDVQEYKDCGYQSQYWLAAKYGDPAFYDAQGNWRSDSAWSTALTLPPNACGSRPPQGYDAAGSTVAWPRNLLRASDPANMINSVKSALASIASETGSLSGLAQSSGSLDTEVGGYTYRTQFDTGVWTGDVQAHSVTTDGVQSSTPDWTASGQLPGWTARTILTFNDGRTPTGATESRTNSRRGVVFDPATFATSFSTGQQAALNTNETGAPDTWGADRVKYLRGDRSNEAPNGHQWRERTSLLGDMINSTPVNVGAPPFGVSSDASYAGYRAAHRSRKPMLYVGGNDGMLHGYDASFNAGDPPTPTATSGRELVAYVPAAVYRTVNQLMSPTYTHKFYVDGSPVYGEACFNDCSDASDWKSVLVGSLNAGGQGVFALDVTDPASFSASNVLWEFTDRDDADLGYTFSRPIVTMMNDGKWYVVFGNGYNNTQPDGAPSTTGRAYLYFLKVEGPGPGGSWALNTNYFKIELKSPGETSSPSSPANGLSDLGPLDKDGDGRTDVIYAGDRDGNLWKIDVSGSTPGSWRPAFGTASAPLPLFSATDGASPAVAQQITTGIDFARHPSGGLMVLFGTGSWIDLSDPIAPFRTDTLYGIWDKDDGSTRVTSRSRLQPQKVLVRVNAAGALCSDFSNDCNTVVSSCSVNYSTTPTGAATATPLCPASLMAPAGTGQRLGWVFDLTHFDGASKAGERTFSTAPKIEGGVATFFTLIPSGDACTGNTRGSEYALNYLTGGQPPSPVFNVGTRNNWITTTAIPGFEGTPVVVYAAGRVSGTGAIKNDVRFTGTAPDSAGCRAAGIPAPPSEPCVGTACPNYIPGWGLLMNLQGGTAQSRRCILHCDNDSSAAQECQWRLAPGQFGRINWKQITR